LHKIDGRAESGRKPHHRGVEPHTPGRVEFAIGRIIVGGNGDSDQGVIDLPEEVRRDAGLRLDPRLDPEILAESMPQGGGRVGVLRLVPEKISAAGAHALVQGVDEEVVRRSP